MFQMSEDQKTVTTSKLLRGSLPINLKNNFMNSLGLIMHHFLRHVLRRDNSFSEYEKKPFQIVIFTPFQAISLKPSTGDVTG